MRSTLLAALILVALTGCSSRNLRRGATFPNAPLERGITLSTRPEFPKAGEDPVEFATPLVTQSLVIVPNESHGIRALEKGTMNVRWKFDVKNGVGAQPVLDENTVYFGGNDGQFYAVDVDLGKILWKYETKSPVYSRPAVSGNHVFFMASDDVLYCLEKATGKWVWHYKRTINAPTTIRGNSTPLVEADRVYVGFSDGYLLALNRKDGNTVWETRINRGNKFTDVDAEPISEGSRIYVPSYDGGLYTLDKTTGKILWFTDVGGSKKIVFDENPESKSLYLPSSDGRVLSLNRETGKVNWAFELDLGTPTNIAVHGTYLLFGSSRQYLYVVHKGDGSLAYRFNAGLRSGFFGSPVQQGRDVFIYSNFGNLYGFRWVNSTQRDLSVQHQGMTGL